MGKSCKILKFMLAVLVVGVMFTVLCNSRKPGINDNVADGQPNIIENHEIEHRGQLETPENPAHEPGPEKGVPGDASDSIGISDEHGRGGLFITPDEIDAFKNLDMRDKLMVLSIISRIDKEDMRNISSIIADGIDYAEIEEIKRILKKYLLPGELNRLFELLAQNKKTITRAK